jgi:mono/diheme cytochrome c family protein
MRKHLRIILGTIGLWTVVGCAPGVVGGGPDIAGGPPAVGIPGNGGSTGAQPGITGTPGTPGMTAGTGGALGVITGTGTIGTGVLGTGGATGNAVSASGLPCDVQAILQAHCTNCHGSTPIGGAPMPLVTYANLTTHSPTYPLMTFAQRAVVRVQALTAPMPPTGPRLTPDEIATISSWIASAYPNGACGATAIGGIGSGGTVGAISGTGGTVGTTTGGGRTATGGTTGGAGATGVTGMASGFPCDIQTFLQNRCTTCHGQTPIGGAPMSLVTYANVTARSSVYTTQTYAQRALVRIQDNAMPMPPMPGTRATAAETQALSGWIAAGYPAGTCVGATGAGGAAGGVPDPLSRPAICTSRTTWTGGNNGSASMNPGRACISCHTSGGGGEDGEDENEAPRFAIAGTLYPTGHEPDLCNGVNGTTGARVVIVDGANRTITLTPNAAGNFTYSGALTTPFHAKVTYQGRERIMTAAQTSGDCNRCHTQNGATGAPGRITLP